MNQFLTGEERSTITEIIRMASDLPTPTDLKSLSAEQAICIGFIKGINSKVGEKHEKE